MLLPKICDEFNLDYMTLRQIAIRSFNWIFFLGCLFTCEKNHEEIPWN